MEDERAFDWLFSETILDEYSEVLRRLKVPRNAVGRFINLLRDGGLLIDVKDRGEYSPDLKDDPFYHCAIDGDADYIVTDNARDFPPVKGRKRPVVVPPAEAVRLPGNSLGLRAPSASSSPSQAASARRLSARPMSSRTAMT